MGRTLFVDVLGGAAGDMLLAALLDAGADERSVRDAVEAVVPGRFRFEVETVTRAALRAARLAIDETPGSGERRAPAELREAVDAAGLSRAVAGRARRVIDAIEEVERRVHGETQELLLHELGDDDTLLDVVGFAAAMESLGIDQVLVSAIPADPGSLGPATMQLLAGFELRPAPEGAGETVTPTAAAIFAALGTSAPRGPALRLESIGYGAGTRDPAGYPNVVRVLVGTAAPQQDPDVPRVRPLVVLEANLDDLTPELVADAVEALFGAGALDVWTSPLQMKKGRLGVLLSVLGDPADEARLLRTFFEATSTFGVRTHRVDRAELERRSVAVAVGEGTVRVKLGLLGGRVISATPEHDDVAALARATDRPVRDVYEEAMVAARALRQQVVEP